METILYQFWRSSASYRVRWALAIKGVPFTTVPVDIVHGEHLTPAHLARNPMSHVPALWIDGRWLGESVAILEYLEETRPTPALYPREPWERARVRQVIELVNSGIQPLQNLVAQRRHSAEEAEQQAWSRFFNERGVAACEALIAAIAAEIPGDGRFCVGASLTAADLFVVPQVAHARRLGVDLARCPRLLAIEEAVLATEHAAAALPSRQPGAPASALPLPLP